AAVRVIWHGECKRRTQARIVFDHYHPRLHRAYRLPDPVIVVVDIDRHEADLARDSGVGDERVDVVGLDRAFFQGQPAGLEEGCEAAADGARMLAVRFDPQAAPALDQQLCGVALHAALDAELDEHAVTRPDAPENLLDDAVLV